MIGIYKITSPGGKVYVGQSIDIEKRFYHYKILCNCNNQTKLINSFKKYGINSHIFEVLEECEEATLNEKERYYQDLYNVLENGLNCRLTTTYTKTGKNSLQSREKCKNSMKGKNKGKRPDVSERNKIVHKGKVITEEHRKAISNKLKGKTRGYTGIRGEKLRKPVLQWDKTGTVFIKEWSSITEAAKFINRRGGDIVRVATGRGKTCAGFYWTYKN